MAEFQLDLRGVACPMNFVKTRLFLDKMQEGDLVCVLLDGGEPVESVSESIVQDGHTLEARSEMTEGHFMLSIRKGKE
ncbi:MAG TPA: sulfurtransferase TusA family protein [Candidatus Melainabacteria bacterium]|nr:sulfurtransferase TusA family protein [Candidatus Melainabacteria bacterium]